MFSRQAEKQIRQKMYASLNLSIWGYNKMSATDNYITACMNTIKNYFLCPHIDRSGVHSFWPVRLFVRTKYYTGHIFWLLRFGALIFHMSIPCDKTFLLVSSSRSSVRVKYQGHSFRKNGRCGGIGVSQKHLVFFLQTKEP